MAIRVQNRYRDLIQQAENLKNSDQFETTSRQLKLLQQAWREVNGNLPKKQASELWTRFRAANNHFFERLKAHIAAQQAAGAPGAPATPEVLLARKRALAERAEALMSIPPQEAIHQAKALQTEWKQVGTVRGEESDRIWQRFMVACDKIFELSALEYHLRKRADGAAHAHRAGRARPLPGQHAARAAQRRPPGAGHPARQPRQPQPQRRQRCLPADAANQSPLV